MQSSILLIIFNASAAWSAYIGGINYSAQIQRRVMLVRRFESSSQEENLPQDDELPPDIKTVATIKDDGLTDRFKYKVHALMGDYDVVNGEDTDKEGGNILNAMLEFPTVHMFTAIGKTVDGPESVNEFVQKVKDIVADTSGQDGFECKVTPRGKKFTKVSVSVMVESPSVINSIYDSLTDVTVMRF